MKQFLIVLNEGQTCISNIRLPDQIVETLFSYYDDSPLHAKFLKLFKCFRLVFQQLDITIPTQIICEGQKITIPIGERSMQFQKFPMLMRNLSRRCIATRGGECFHVPS